MDCFKVNLDYEAYLFEKNYNENSHKSLSFIKEFEYVFFLINNHTCFLKNYSTYDEDYLGSLRKFGFVIPSFSPNETKFINWWGPQFNKELEKKLNSKLTSAELALKSGWGLFDGAIVANRAEAQEWMSQFSHTKWILKNPYGVSGSGHHVYKGQEFLGLHLLEPIHQRLFDIGTTFEVYDGVLKNKFMVLNLNSNNGAFKGGIAGMNLDIFKNYILEKYNYDLTSLEEITNEIFKSYQTMGAISNLQIDSFVYCENNILKLYPLVEVNYRKTMGLVLQNLAIKLNSNLIEWKITHTDDFEMRSEWIKLSPNGNRFKSYVRVVS
jgi:hypothetical protein